MVNGIAMGARAMMVVAVALACWCGAEGEDNTPLRLGAEPVLFVDRSLIERADGVELRLSKPERREVVLVTDRPWEGPQSAYFSVLRDGERILLYYRGFCRTDLGEDQVTCVAESRDGITFTRPTVGLYDFAGSRENNIVHRGVESHNFAPFLDANPAAPPSERFKALGGVDGKLFAFVSEDGYRWRKLTDRPVLTEGAFDSLNVAFWDSKARLYRCYSRAWTGGGYAGYRAIQSCTSRDFRSWTKPILNRYPAGVPDEHFYTNATTPCPDAPGLLLSFPKRFVPERKRWQDYPEPGVSDAVFMTSRDGVHWDRTFREAWLRPGRDPKNWTQRSNMPATGVIQTAPDEWSLYVTERYGWPDHRVRRVTVRRQGLASVHAGAAGGEFVTPVLRLEGEALVVNYATSAAGSLQVEVQDEGGKPLPGYSLVEMAPLFGDEIARAVRWKSRADVSGARGRPVRLRFRLRDADLYAVSVQGSSASPVEYITNR